MNITDLQKRVHRVFPNAIVCAYPLSYNNLKLTVEVSNGEAVFVAGYVVPSDGPLRDRREQEVASKLTGKIAAEIAAR